MTYDEAVKHNTQLKSLFRGPKKAYERWALFDDGTVGLLLRYRIEDSMVLVGLPTQVLKHDYRYSVKVITLDEWNRCAKILLSVK